VASPEALEVPAYEKNELLLVLGPMQKDIIEKSSWFSAQEKTPHASEF
jgi:hypothetical protein